MLYVVVLRAVVGAARTSASLYVVASVLAFVLYGVDKRAAVAGSRRIPEATLHLVAVLGGWPGAVVAQTVFRHKTQKSELQAAVLGDGDGEHHRLRRS